MDITKISIADLLKQYNTHLDDSIIGSNDVIVIPDSRLSADDISVIKKIRSEGKKVYIPDSQQFGYQELRGGEFELALLIISQTALPLVINIVSSWIYEKMSRYSELKKEIKNDDLQRPPFKLKFYFTKDTKYVNLEGEPEDVLKGLDKIKKDYDAS